MRFHSGPPVNYVPRPGCIDRSPYESDRLLARALPAVIKSEDENNRILAIIEGLLAKGEQNLTPEEDALLELLVDLARIEAACALARPGVEEQGFRDPVRKTGDQ